MSDFLGRLIDRAMERAPLLERRKPSMFEPSSFSAEGISEEPVFVESQASRSVSTAPPATTTVPETERPEAREGASVPLVRHASIASESPHQARNAVAPFITPVAPERAPERIIERHEMQTREIETVIERSETRAIETREIVREPHIEQRTILVEREPEAPRTAGPPRSDLTIAMPKAASTVIAREITPARLTAAGRPTAAAAPRGPSRERTLPPAPAPAIEAPTVTVTIGRVDIRAGEPARSTPRAAKTLAPQLSLEEYLKSRGGGVQ